MFTTAQVVSGKVINIGEEESLDILSDPEWVASQEGVWYDTTALDPTPQIGWSHDGSTFTPPQLQEVTNYRTILTGTEWVELFTDQEWKWLKQKRNEATAAGERLDQMMDAIRWTNSIDTATSQMDEFYAWLVTQGIPGGQTRVDELRQGIAETSWVEVP